MISLALGLAAFLLYFLYDINSFSWQRSFPRFFFALGTALLAGAAGLDLYAACRINAFDSIVDWILIFFALMSIIALIYSLFLALPFEETYAKQTDGRNVYDKGVYALCRHPGILFFFLLFFFLGLAAAPFYGLLLRGMFFSLMDLAYACFQDRITFPRTFCDYKRYQQETPFLIPTKASFRLACQNLRHQGEKEVES